MGQKYYICVKWGLKNWIMLQLGQRMSWEAWNGIKTVGLFRLVPRGVVRLSASQFRVSKTFTFLIFPQISITFFPQIFLNFVLILALRVGRSPTWEGPGYATISAPGNGSFNDTLTNISIILRSCENCNCPTTYVPWPGFTAAELIPEQPRGIRPKIMKIFGQEYKKKKKKKERKTNTPIICIFKKIPFILTENTNIHQKFGRHNDRALLLKNAFQWQI